MATHGHAHQHSVKAIGSGASFDQALNHALAGLADPEGHHSMMNFHSFEVVKVAGTFDPKGERHLQVTIEAFGSHKS